nr:MAG TPA: hypothetical protein [Caudoviricetes sp.]
MKALEVAKYVVTKCKKDEYPISNLQLQKILYYIQHDFLKKNNKPLFDDDFEAWKFGPVVPSVYYEYSYLGALKIYEEYDDYDKIIQNLGDNILLINSTVCKKRNIDPWTLVSETHAKGKAWDIIFKDGAGFGDVIPKQQIKDNAF